MKEITFLILFLFSTMLLISKSFSSSENDEFIKLKETHDIICKNVTLSNLEEIGNNWKLQKKSKYLQLFANKIDQKTLQIRPLYRANQIQKIIFTFYKVPNRPILEIRSNKNCNVQSIMKIIYNKNLIPQEIHSINISNYKIDNTKLLNPELPKLKSSNNMNVIALIDTGINYSLKIVQKNIAVKDRQILGFDF
tara:strand:- start:69 stop:650 length:582 start_codon:yes stop_codon:yes gene_type:complete